MLNIKAKRNKGEKVPGEDYIYASAMIRTRETHRINYDALMRMADAKDVSEICKMLPEYSIDPIYSHVGEIDAEATVTAYLAKEFEAISKAMPQRAILDFLRVSYDCHNLKTVIKCAARGREDCHELFIDLGTVPADKVLGAVRDEKLSIFPRNMASAYERARKAFNESGDPKLIDSILDGACYADMLEATGAYRKDYFRDLVEIKIDTTNVTTAVRTLRMGDTTGLFDSMFLNGGSLSADFFKNAMQSGEEGLFSALRSTRYAVSSTLEPISLTELGKRCEGVYMRYVDRAKSIDFGAEICVAYLIRATYATKMLRMLIASKQTGTDVARIKDCIGKF